LVDYREKVYIVNVWYGKLRDFKSDNVTDTSQTYYGKLRDFKSDNVTDMSVNLYFPANTPAGYKHVCESRLSMFNLGHDLESLYV